MGCAGSKAGTDVAVADVVYRPPPTSVSLFDISAVEEPWRVAKKKAAGDGDDDDDDDEDSSSGEDDEEETDEEEEEEEEKPAAVKTTVVPLPLLEKLEGYELAPASWSEVSKALEDMKPVLDSNAMAPPAAAAAAASPKKKRKKKKTKKAKKKKNKKQDQQQPKTAGAAADEVAADTKAPPPELAGRRVVKDNPFLMRDRESKGGGGGGDGTAPKWKRRDPFEGCPERRPPGAAGGGVVLYTTTLRGVRRTFEDCERARELVEACAEAAGVGAVDERDVSLHPDYLRELRELLAGGGGGGGGDDLGAAAASAVVVVPPRLFVMGRYVGGAEDCVRLAESGKLREMMRWVKARGEACAAKDGRGCEGCGGARFVPCWECGGSCKVVAEEGGEVERCAKCNENGLMMCPVCH
jgi:glutaredoxin domain-containing cysteine-rich protein 1